MKKIFILLFVCLFINKSFAYGETGKAELNAPTKAYILSRFCTEVKYNFAFYDKKAKHMTIIIGIQHRFFNIKVWDEYYYILSIFSITDMWSLLAEYLRQLYKLDIKEVNLCAFTTTNYKIKYNSEPKVKYYLKCM